MIKLCDAIYFIHGITKQLSIAVLIILHVVLSIEPEERVVKWIYTVHTWLSEPCDLEGKATTPLHTVCTLLHVQHENFDS